MGLRRKAQVVLFFSALCILIANSLGSTQTIVLRGVVLSQEGLPQPGARVIFSSKIDTVKMKETLTDAAGTFAMSLLPATPYNLRIMAPGYPLQYFDKSMPDSSADSPPTSPFPYSNNEFITMRLTMTPRKLSTYYGSISGIVRDSAGFLLPQITIMALMLNKDVTAEVKTDNQGHYTCFVPMGPHFIMASANNFPMQFWGPNGNTTTAEPTSVNVLTVLPNGNINADLLLKGAAQTAHSVPTAPHAGISGHVIVKSNNQPAAGVTVCALKSDSTNNSMMNPGFDPQKYPTPYNDTTRADGSYSIMNMPRGKYIVYTKGQNYITQFFSGAEAIGNAQPVAIDTTMKTAIDFSLRLGGSLSGRITTRQGKAVGQAQVSCNAINGTTSSWCFSDSSGRFLMTGLIPGIYCLNVNYSSFLTIQNDKQCNFTVTEGATLDNISLVVDLGGVIKGAYTAPTLQDSLPNAGFEIALFADSLAGAQGLLQENGTAWAAINALSQGEFVSSGVPAGKWRYVFRPWQKANYSYGLGQPYRACRAYSFGSAATLSTQTPIVISGGDTARIPTVNFVKGYAVSATISLEGGEKGVSCNITAYIKDGTGYVPVSRANAFADSVFELPGLIDGQEYFIGINAPGYQPQFWSSQGSSIKPVSAYRFSTTAFAKPTLRALKTPQGYFDAAPAISAWWKSDTGAAKAFWIFCNTPMNLNIDTLTLYGRDPYGTVSPIVKFPYSSSQMTYSWKVTLTESQILPQYVFVGKGVTSTVRSNIVQLDKFLGLNPSSGSLVAFLTPMRSCVQIDWKIDSLLRPSASDTIILLRKTAATAEYSRYSTSWGTSGSFRDNSFEKNTNIAAVYYKVQLSSKRIAMQSVELKFGVTQAFIDNLPRQLLVGANEQYKTIQAAVDAAKDYDVIRIDPGVGDEPYSENISLQGKVVSLEGNWQNGRPPAISGEVAITVPYTSKSLGDDQISINGLKIINSRTGIKTYSNVNINQCLFVGNISEAVLCLTDSAAVAQAALTDLFAQYQVNSNIWQCTFVGKNQAIIAVRASTGASPDTSVFSEINKNPMTPGGFININNSIFYAFPSTSLPINVNDDRFTVNLWHCDFWKTSINVPSSRILLDTLTMQIDPQFKDTVDYFLLDSSPLKTNANNIASIGYDNRYWKYDQEQNKPNIPAVKNFKPKVVGPHSISLSWSPLPDSFALSGYVVFRVNGLDSLFIRDQSQWKLNIPDDSVFTHVDTFRTMATFFIDTTAIVGKPYIYAVAGIDSSGNPGKVNMPDSIPLSSYIVKIDLPRKVNNLVARAYGFTNVLLQWNKPPSGLSAPATYALCRFTGGDSLIAAARDSGAVRKLVLASKTNATAVKSFSVRDTFLIDANAALGAVHLYVATLVDTLVPFESRALTWAVVKTDSLPCQEQRPHRIPAHQWNMIGPWGVGGLGFERDSGKFIYRWNDDKVADKLYSQYSVSNVMQSGAGYWFQCNTDTEISVTASMHQAVVQNRDSLFITLRKGLTGWNQVSSPLPFPVRPSWLDNDSFAVYAWNGDSAQYTDQTALRPWKGYWIHTYHDTLLPVRPSDVVISGNGRAMGKRLAMSQWELQVSLSGAIHDPDNFIGVFAPGASKKSRLAFPKPPQAFDFPQLFFIDNESGKNTEATSEERLAKLYKASPAVPIRKLEWMIGISPASKDAFVTIHGASKLPSSVSLFWVSGATALNLRENPEITVKAHAQNVYGYIVATANPRDIGIYTKRFELRGCYPNPVRSTAAIDFTIPYSWNSDGSKKEGETRDLSLGVYDMAGRCVATVFSGKICVGEHRLIWRGSSEAGHMVAQGAYVIRLSGSDFQKTMKIMKLR